MTEEQGSGAASRSRWRTSLAVSMVFAVAGAGLVATLVSCNQPRLALVPDRVRTPPGIREACALAETKCSRCHDLERIRVSRFSRNEWSWYVDRMRRQPDSGITERDGATILNCLTYASRQPGAESEPAR